MKIYYFDNSATSEPKPKEVYEAVKESLEKYNINPGRSGYRKSIDVGRKIFEVREKVSKFFNLKNSLNVAFTANATEALNFAIQGSIKNKSHVITSNFEHNSVLRPLFYLKDKRDVELTFIDRYDEIEKNIKSNTKAIVINHISNVNGTIQDIKKIGEICKKYNILFILDASQSAGYVDIDMERDNIDILCITGHKSLYGIQGIGAICIKDNIEIEPILEGGTGSFSKLSRQPKDMPEKLEAGTLNTPGILSLGAGIDYINKKGLENIKKHEDILIDYLIKELQKLDKIILYKSITENQGPLISFNIEGIDANEVGSILDEEFGVLVRSGFHCAPKAHESIGTYETGTIRISIGYFNTLEEIKYLIEKIKYLISAI